MSIQGKENCSGAQPGGALEATRLIAGAARKHLRRLKGAKLAVLIWVLLCCDEDGWTEVNLPQLERDTGYMRHAVARAVRGLCRFEVDGRRLMLMVAERKGAGLPRKLHLRLFPSDADLRLQPKVGRRTSLRR